MLHTGCGGSFSIERTKKQTNMGIVIAKEGAAGFSASLLIVGIGMGKRVCFEKYELDYSRKH